MPRPVTISATVGEFEAEAIYTPGRASGQYHEPDEAPSLELTRVTRDGVVVDFEDLDAWDRDAIENALAERVIADAWPW